MPFTYRPATNPTATAAADACRAVRARRIECRRMLQPRFGAPVHPAPVDVGEQRSCGVVQAPASHQREGHREVDEHVPGDEAEQRESQDLDTPGTIEYGKQCTGGYC